jgi:hypothetical protein
MARGGTTSLNIADRPWPLSDDSAQNRLSEQFLRIDKGASAGANNPQQSLPGPALSVVIAKLQHIAGKKPI